MRTAIAITTLLAGLAFGCAKQGPTARSCKDVEQKLADTEARLADLEGMLADSEGAKALAEKRLAAYRDIAKKLRDAFGSDELDIIIRNGRLVVQLPNKILFDFAKTELKPEGKEALAKLAGVLKTVKGRNFLLAGHTDNVPVKKSNPEYKSNWQLSTLRSLSAVEYLVSQGVKAEALGAAGYGEFQPEESNDTEDGRAENRRTEIIIMPTIDEIPKLPREI